VMKWGSFRSLNSIYQVMSILMPEKDNSSYKFASAWPQAVILYRQSTTKKSVIITTQKIVTMK
jgi:hypothetical protein